MPRFDKWLTGVGKAARVSTAARKALRLRLRAVEHYLKAAAQSPASRTEAIHQLRVWCRRAEAALQLFAPVVPAQKLAWFHRKLKKLRRAAGEARDCDVLLARLKGEPPSPAAERLAKSLAARRKAARPPLVELYKSLGASGRLKHKRSKLLNKLAWSEPRAEPPFSAWAPTSVAPALSDFLQATHRQVTAPDRLHALRISGKRLRYALELVADCYGPGVRKGIYGELSEFQERLGKVCDHRAAQQQFLEWQSAAETAEDRRYFQAVAKSEQKQFEASRKQFLAWWSAARRKAFVAQCEKCQLKPPAPKRS